MAKYGDQVIYNLDQAAKDALLAEYSVDKDSKSIDFVEMEAGNDPKVNVITFYFTRKSADVIISKTVRLDPKQAEEQGIHQLPASALVQDFEFTLYNSKGFYKSVYDCVITDSNGVERNASVIAGTREMVVTLKHGESIRIKDLAIGKYTVTETYVPGFLITIGNDKDPQQKKDVTITLEMHNAGEHQTVSFTNSYPFYVGDLVLGKTIVKADNRDPDANDTYQINVKITPADETREVDREIKWMEGSTQKTFTVPKLTNTSADERVFEFNVLVPVNQTVTLEGVPAGDFVATEIPKGTVGIIADYYKVKTFNKTHNTDVENKIDGHVVEGVIHGGHPTTVTFNNTYKKGDLTLKKTFTTFSRPFSRI